MLLGDVTPLLGGAAAIIGALATFFGLWLSRRSEREANDTQHQAVAAKVKLDEVESLRVVVETLSDECDRLKGSLHDANEAIDRVNRELNAAYRNVGRLRVALQMNGVPIPDLEPMHDVI